MDGPVSNEVWGSDVSYHRDNRLVAAKQNVDLRLHLGRGMAMYFHQLRKVKNNLLASHRTVSSQDSWWAVVKDGSEKLQIPLLNSRQNLIVVSCLLDVGSFTK